MARILCCKCPSCCRAVARDVLLSVWQMTPILCYAQPSITNFEVHSHNVLELANHGGCLRWKIENEGFNVQKHGGYALEHIFTHHPVATKVFYLLLQLAHTLAQLIEHGSLFCQAFPAVVARPRPRLAAPGSLARCPPQRPVYPRLVGQPRPDSLPATLAPPPGRFSAGPPPQPQSYPHLWPLPACSSGWNSPARLVPQEASSGRVVSSCGPADEPQCLLH